MRYNLANIISLVHKANIFEWVAEALPIDQFRQVFILLHTQETEFERHLRSKGFTVYRLPYANKRHLPLTVLRIIRLLRKENINTVHTHLVDAGLAGQLAAWCARIPKRIHTRHDATVNHTYYPHAVKYDKLTNRLATRIIAITDSVKEILMELEGVPAQKIEIIHHGFHLTQFSEVAPERVQALTAKYFPNGRPERVVGVISRYMHWKGIQHTIAGFQEFLQTTPGAHLVLANATGPYRNEVQALLRGLPEGSFTEIPFEYDSAALYHLFDVFVHVPVDERAEAFGQIYIEAMAAGIPCVVTLSGIARTYIRHRQNALVVPFQNSAAIANALSELVKDPLLRQALIRQAKLDVDPAFTVPPQVAKLVTIYLS